MPAELINIRQLAVLETGYTLRRKIDKDGWLHSGYIHFPAGCNGLVQVRLSVEISGTEMHLIPIPDRTTNTAQFVALDNFTLPFPLDVQVKKNDVIVFEINNYDLVFNHNISLLVIWSKQRLFGEEMFLHDRPPGIPVDRAREMLEELKAIREAVTSQPSAPPTPPKGFIREEIRRRLP